MRRWTPTAPRRRSRAVGRSLVIAAVLGLGAAATAGGIALASSGNRSAPSNVASSSVDPAVLAQLSVLGRPKTQADALPNALQWALGHADTYAAPDAADARVVTASDGQTAYVAPAELGACVVNTNETFCAPPASLAGADAIDLCSPTLPAGQMELEWLLPDGATSVSVRREDGSAIAFPAGYNVYITRLPLTGSTPKTINWTLAGQNHSAPTGVPNDAASGKCVHPGDAPPASSEPTLPPGVYELDSSGQIEPNSVK